MVINSGTMNESPQSSVLRFPSLILLFLSSQILHGDGKRRKSIVQSVRQVGGVFMIPGRQDMYESSPESASYRNEWNATNGETAHVVSERGGRIQKPLLPQLDVEFPGVESDTSEEVCSCPMNPGF